MAEVIRYWPDVRQARPKRFAYPWEAWMALDENLHGDIWLAELGVDFPADSTVHIFRSMLYDRAKKITANRKRDAPLVLMRVGDKVKRVPQYTPLRVQIRIVSLTQVAFRFYESEEPPYQPEGVRHRDVSKTAVTPTLSPAERARRAEGAAERHSAMQRRGLRKPGTYVRKTPLT